MEINQKKDIDVFCVVATGMGKTVILQAATLHLGFCSGRQVVSADRRNLSEMFFFIFAGFLRCDFPSFARCGPFVLTEDSPCLGLHLRSWRQALPGPMLPAVSFSQKTAGGKSAYAERHRFGIQITYFIDKTVRAPLLSSTDCFACPHISRLRVPLSADVRPIFAASKRAIRVRCGPRCGGSSMIDSAAPSPGHARVGGPHVFPGRVQVGRAFFSNASCSTTSSLIALSHMVPSTRNTHIPAPPRTSKLRQGDAGGCGSVDCAP
ncbi:hypothetical protein DFH08DRAFT_963311 [Mycena albidolilacea]|uniref:Uncharacterized protein n=1 Tax=Mycena albidolilacea TaxID=1033008 RepID=A0AAD6ZVQ7_9AGAR|nr:hypothetical protein DFH08DRAFT_963311 [Mycena albidolilacea]